VIDFGEETFIAKNQLYEAVVHLISQLENDSDLTLYFFRSYPKTSIYS